MSKRRPGKKTDQVETEKAYQILVNAMQNHPEIEQTLRDNAASQTQRLRYGQFVPV